PRQEADPEAEGERRDDAGLLTYLDATSASRTRTTTTAPTIIQSLCLSSGESSAAASCSFASPRCLRSPFVTCLGGSGRSDLLFFDGGREERRARDDLLFAFFSGDRLSGDRLF